MYRDVAVDDLALAADAIVQSENRTLGRELLGPPTGMSSGCSRMRLAAVRESTPVMGIAAGSLLTNSSSDAHAIRSGIGGWLTLGERSGNLGGSYDKSTRILQNPETLRFRLVRFHSPGCCHAAGTMIDELLRLLAAPPPNDIGADHERNAEERERRRLGNLLDDQGRDTTA